MASRAKQSQFYYVARYLVHAWTTVPMRVKAWAPVREEARTPPPGRDKSSSPGNFLSLLRERARVWKKSKHSRAPPPRAIHFNDPDENRVQRFCSNRISTSKYSLYSFFPRFLFDQFSRYANLFFLGVIILQQIPGVSPTGRFTTAVPLLLVLLATAVKEIIEDLRRHNADSIENGRMIDVFRLGIFQSVPWIKVVVGDIVKVRRGQFFPSDLILLSSSEPQGICYIETSNLDGETNLKIRQSCDQTANISKRSDLNLLRGKVECEGPNTRLYEFSGNITIQNDRPEPLSANQILLRGAQLRNTDWIYGLVIYTGHDTKLMRNSTKAPLKRSNMDHVTNRQVFLLFIVLVTLSVLSSVGSSIWNSFFEDESYLSLPASSGAAAGSFFLSILTFIILYNNLIPISLIVTLEIVKYVQTYFINNDLEMYDEETDTPALARNSNLNEELGQVKYIFSDKTGTLTQNIMEFKLCSINGHVYRIGVPPSEDGHASSLKNIQMTPLQDVLESRHQCRDEVMEFLKVMAICHSVIPEQTRDGVIYRSSSPDEQALVNAARSLGIVFESRTPDTITIDVMGYKEEYKILNLLEFSSARKRMSVIVRKPNGTIKLFCKGADSVIYGRLHPNDPLSKVTGNHLERFAVSGLRTLCVTETVLEEDVYEKWSEKYYQASIALEKREERLDQVSEEIELNLCLLGATAIDDKLQTDVPESIEALRKANIKIWVLTGDKQETAITIGYASRQLTSSMHIMILEGHTPEEVHRNLGEFEGKIGQANLTKKNKAALIVDGKTLEYALDPLVQESFLNVALACRSVICCRVSPSQKAAVVEMVKVKVKNSITLAIGDGANDVGMIQAAHVGVGISGREGLQATLASDYAIAQFRFLVRLLLVHGAWNYSRLSKLILYFFYKNITLYLIQFWFALFSGFSGQPIFERWTIGLYNVIFTIIPPFVLGLLDKDVSATSRMKRPTLYILSQCGESFNTKVFWVWIGMAVFHSAALFFIIFYGLSHEIPFSDGKVAGMWYIGTAIYTATVVTVSLKAALESENWTWVTHVAIWGSIASWFVFLPVYSHLWPGVDLGVELFGLDTALYSSFYFYLTFVLVPCICVLPDFAWKVYIQSVNPPELVRVKQLEKLAEGSKKPVRYEHLDEMSVQYQHKRDRGEDEEGSSVTFSGSSFGQPESFGQRGYAFSEHDHTINGEGKELHKRDLIRMPSSIANLPFGESS
ncbi:hypothetical protein EMCRGX_G033797 [Ephydatia muelleri]